MGLENILFEDDVPKTDREIYTLYHNVINVQYLKDMRQHGFSDIEIEKERAKQKEEITVVSLNDLLNDPKYQGFLASTLHFDDLAVGRLAADFAVKQAKEYIESAYVYEYFQKFVEGYSLPMLKPYIDVCEKIIGLARPYVPKDYHFVLEGDYERNIGRIKRKAPKLIAKKENPKKKKTLRDITLSTRPKERKKQYLYVVMAPKDQVLWEMLDQLNIQEKIEKHDENVMNGNITLEEYDLLIDSLYEQEVVPYEKHTSDPQFIGFKLGRQPNSDKEIGRQYAIFAHKLAEEIRQTGGFKSDPLLQLVDGYAKAADILFKDAALALGYFAQSYLDLDDLAVIQNAKMEGKKEEGEEEKNE
ncbi:hypothetical protein KY316_02455 [Candidatus Woesearchaeota archaeon]|nr:hypothetical protein [Candidatus Woesearchaeota archaeon]